MDDQGQLGGQNAMFVFPHTKDVLALLRILTKLPLKVSFPHSEIPGLPISPFYLTIEEVLITSSFREKCVLRNHLKQLWLALSPFLVLLLSRCWISRFRVVLYLNLRLNSFIINSLK